MSKRAFDKIRAGLNSAHTYLDAATDKKAYGVHSPKSLDETSPFVESVPARNVSRSTMGKSGMRGRFMPRGGW